MLQCVNTARDRDSVCWSSIPDLASSIITKNSLDFDIIMCYDFTNLVTLYYSFDDEERKNYA